MKNTENKIHLAAPLYARLQAIAATEQRSHDELADEAVNPLLKQRSLQRTYSFGEEQARKLGLKEGDAARLIAASRRESEEHGR